MTEQNSRRRLPEDAARLRSARLRSTRLGPSRIGRSAAVAHGAATWVSTDDYIAERTRIIAQTARHLGELRRHCANHRDYEALESLLEETAAFLNKHVPRDLPFLVSSRSAPRRLRLAAVMREWLLTSRHPRRRDHLRRFLRGYQEVSPLCLVEVRLLAVGLRLAVVDKCRLLPSTEKATHLELLPRLIHELTQTCRFVARTNWEKLGEEVSQVHFLLNRDPSHSYPQVDFGTRNACRQSVEQLSRLTRTGEAETAGEAVALAEREKTAVANLLLGPGRESLVKKLSKEPMPNPASGAGPQPPPLPPPKSPTTGLPS